MTSSAVPLLNVALIALVPEPSARPEGGEEERGEGWLHTATAGFRELASTPLLATVVGVYALQALVAGALGVFTVVIDGRRTSRAEVTLERVVESGDARQAVISLVIHEGLNRQVRRMCDAIGHPVVRLRRVRFGPITDPNIRPGEFRDLSAREVAALKRAAGSTAKARAPRPT